MVDPSARRQARALLKRLALRRITGCECENGFIDLAAESIDPVIFAMHRTVKDLIGERGEISPETLETGGMMHERICRWIFFLGTDLDYEWPKTRSAPGLRDLYRASWLDSLSGFDARVNSVFCGSGDYAVWPFFRQKDFENAKAKCSQKKPIPHA